MAKEAVQTRYQFWICSIRILVSVAFICSHGLMGHVIEVASRAELAKVALHSFFVHFRLYLVVRQESTIISMQWFMDSQKHVGNTPDMHHNDFMKIKVIYKNILWCFMHVNKASPHMKMAHFKPKRHLFKSLTLTKNKHKA